MGGPRGGSKTVRTLRRGLDRYQAIDGWGNDRNEHGITPSRWVLPEFGGKRLKQITTSCIRKWIAAMSEEGLSPSTVHAYRRLLDQILEQAVDDGLIIANPTKKAKAPPARPRRQLFLSADELRQLTDECGGFAPLVWFLGWSGVRFGEAAALRVGRVDPERRRVRIEEAATEVAGRLGLRYAPRGS